MTFGLNDLVLHPQSRRIAEKIAEDLPHGLIIDGPVGIGVRTVAEAIAKQIGAVAFVIEPKKKLKGELAVDLHEGSVIIEDIRQLYDQTRTKQNGKHVYIIDTGDKSMTHSAQNAFLKLLEEPRPGIHFIIATHQFDLLLPTIASRSQRLSLQAVTPEQTTELIGSLAIQDDTKRARLAFVGRGLPALITRLAGDESAYEARIAIMRDAKTLLGDDPYEKLVTIHRYREARGDALTLIDDMNYQLRTILRTQPKKQFVSNIERFLDVRMAIAAGGNIRLHLTSSVL